MAIAEITIIPIGTETTSLSGYVAYMHKILKQYEGEIDYQLTAMSTIIEADLNKLWEVIARLHETPFESGAKRVSTSVKIDDRRDKAGTIQQKLQSVADKME